MLQLVVTKLEIGDWWGYYIGDTLYGFGDYYNFSDDEVEREAVLRAIDEGLMKTRKDEHEVVLDYATNWPEFVSNEDLWDILEDTFSCELPPTLTELKAWVTEHKDNKWRPSRATDRHGESE